FSRKGVDGMATILEYARRMIRGEAPPPPVARLVGFHLQSLEPGHAVFTFDADERHTNPMGTLHGGIYCDVADAAMAMAYAAKLPEGESMTTIELKINFLKPVRQAKLTFEARLLSAGKTIGYLECDVKDEGGRLVARASSTCMTIRRAADERPTG